MLSGDTSNPADDYADSTPSPVTMPPPDSRDESTDGLPLRSAASSSRDGEPKDRPRRRPESFVSAQQDGRPLPVPMPSPSRGRFVRDSPSKSSGSLRSDSDSLFRLSMPSITPGQLAFSALQFLPVPLLVLNNLKTVVLANEAMGRLLGLVTEDADSQPDETPSVLERLRGQSLSQVGIDMIQDGRPVWVAWEAFLDSLVIETDSKYTDGPDGKPDQTEKPARSMSAISTEIKPAVESATRPPPNSAVEVIISRRDQNKKFDSHDRLKGSDFQAQAKMIISVWEVEDHQVFYTLTFTHKESSPSSPPLTRKSTAKSKTLEVADQRTIAAANAAPTTASSHSSSSPSYITSPGSVSLVSSPFPPMGPPAKIPISSTPSILQKTIIMKDALLDNTTMPIFAMWRDGSVTFPNAAARRLFRKNADFDHASDGFELLSNWAVYTDDFSRQLEPEEYPISVLVRTQTPFDGMRIGMLGSDGSKIVFDTLGEAIRDNTTGEFLAGVVTCRDVTKMAQEITQIKEKDEERFKLICDTMPQLVSLQKYFISWLPICRLTDH